MSLHFSTLVIKIHKYNTINGNIFCTEFASNPALSPGIQGPHFLAAFTALQLPKYTVQILLTFLSHLEPLSLSAIFLAGESPDVF